MKMWSYVVILTVTVACFSTGVFGVECGEKTGKQMRTFQNCCNLEMNVSRELEAQVNVAVAACRGAVPPSAEAKKGPFEEEIPEGYECMQQCVFMKLGVQGEDKEVKRDTVMELIRNVFPGDFKDVAEKALGECLDENKSAYIACPNGLSSGADCLGFKIVLNCPEKYWTQSDVCSEGKKYYEKCGLPKRDNLRMRRETMLKAGSQMWLLGSETLLM